MEFPDTEEVTGSNPVRPTHLTWYFLFLALSGSALRPYNWLYSERYRYQEEVTGSNPVLPTRHFLFLARGIVKTCGSAATLFFPPAVLLTTLIFATVLAVAKSWGRIRGCRTPGVQGR